MKRNRNLEDYEGNSEGILPYAISTKQVSRITVPIDEAVQEAKYYRDVCHVIANASEHDQIEFEISSPGGYLNGLIALLTAMAKTDAKTVAYINGECHSAASILALNCDTVYVSPYSTMLVHFVSYGVEGKGSDIVSKVQHMHSTCQDLFRETYEFFLTPEEMERCIGGYELWLDAEGIRERLKRKFEGEKTRSEQLSAPKPKNPKTKSKVVPKAET